MTPDGDDIKRWTAKERRLWSWDHSRQDHGLRVASQTTDPSRVERWVDEGKRGMENACWQTPVEIKAVNASSVSLTKAGKRCWSCALEKLASCWAAGTK